MSGGGADRSQVRLASVVLLIAALGWLGGSALGGALGLPVRFALLLDLAAMAAMVWALVVLVREWRRDRGGE